MRLTSEHFLEEACRWGYEHHTRHIDDDEFLPFIKAHGGVTETDVEQLKETLERSGRIRNLRGIGGIMRDFELLPSVFHQYLRRVLPATILAEAQKLYGSWNRSPRGPFNIAIFVEQLGVSEAEARYYFEVVRSN